MTLADLRKDYSMAGLSEKDLARDPFRQFDKWFGEAVAAKIDEPNAMVLSTADRTGRPASRTVLLRAVDGRGFVFYTHYEGRKGRELEVNPRASIVFPWFAIERQVIVSLGLTAISLFGVVIAIFIGVGLVAKEIDKRTLYTVLARPARRF